ncbi:unnamed protein product [Cochlearia groenlandica]
MGKNRSVITILCFLTTITLSSISVSSQDRTCDKTDGIFKPNSLYDKNLRLILSSLPSNVTSHQGYFNGSIGFGQDRVYSMGMCAQGAKPDVCSSCLEAASTGLLQTCPNQTDAFSWFGDDIVCLVRYSSKPLSGVLVLEPFKRFYNVMDVRKENEKGFYSVWDSLTSRLIIEASSSSSSRRNSSSSLSSSSSKYYAKEVAPVPVYGNISMLMQCSPDVSSENCKLCLEKSVEYYNTWYYGKRGTVILRPSCFFRWELYTFVGAFDGTHDTPSTRSPLKSPSMSNVTDVTKKNGRVSGGIVAAIVVVIVVAVILIAIGLVIFKKRKQNQAITLQSESVQFDLKTIEVATSNFSESNKLGEGGFGEVYKGTLPDGTEVAVKRLSKTSGQGETEFKNEVLVVAKLQHRNLVRLLGFSIQGEEKLLVYEYVPNKSLDFFLFDPKKKAHLGWTVRHNIISGITRGILYLHQDSRLTIIHRDLKASNILLDANMNPKIADFGMARIFEMDQGGAKTRRVVGTFGYMAPEYVSHGAFSTKSDVYSFGVLILEIISGKKNSSFHRMDGSVNNLVTYVWRLWKNHSITELIDPSIQEECMQQDRKRDEIVRCIHIGLLCVQANQTDRPAMWEVHKMITNSSLGLNVPGPPGFFFPNGQGSSQSTTSKSFTCSVDEVTITSVDPR